MRYRKLSADGDYMFGNGQSDFWRDVPEAVGQAAMTRLQLWFGEWYLNVDEGTPYLQGILGKHNKTVADITLQERVLNTQGATDLSDYESILNADTRRLSVVTCVLDTIYGPTPVTYQNYANY